MASGVYQILTQVNGKRYIGSAVNIRKRWQTHLSDLRCQRHSNCHLQRAFEKYGEHAFSFSVLECIEDFAQLIPREQHFLDTLKPEYNILPTAGSWLGCHLSPETRCKISEAMMGKRHSEEARKKISEARKGKARSEETCLKISETMRGRHYSKARRSRMSEAQMGHEVTERTRRKLSKAAKAYWDSIRMDSEGMGVNRTF